MTDESVEENIQFSLEAIDLNKDIEMTDGLFRNENMEDCVLSEKKTKNFLLSPFLLLSFLI